MEINWPGEKLLIKIVETFERGCGTLARPWIIRRDGKAKADVELDAVRRTYLELEKLRSDVQAVRRGDKVIDEQYRLVDASTDAKKSMELGQQLIRSVANERLPASKLLELERQINLEQTLLIALEEHAEDEEQISDEDVSYDWFSQWRNRAQDISDKDMQLLWARILAGEAKAPGTYSVHTLDFLSRMSRSDAELISKVFDFVLDGNWISSELQEVYEKADIYFGSLLRLQELGVLSGVEGMISQSKPFTDYGDYRLLLVTNNGAALRVAANKQDQKSIEFGAYSLTLVGQELLKIAELKHHKEYLCGLATKYQGKSSKISIGTVSRVENGVQFSEEEVLWNAEDVTDLETK